MSSRLAIDIGGTFTDATLIDEETGAVVDRQGAVDARRTRRSGSWHAARADPRGVGRRGRRTSASSSTGRPSRRTRSSRGTIARGGFVTTEGFRDVLEIARQIRPTLYDMRFEKPPPLVPRDRAFGVRGAARPRRRGADGRSTRTSVRAVGGSSAGRGRRVGRRLPAPRLRQPRHERRVGEILAEELPGRRRSRSPPRSRPSSASTSAPARPSSTPRSGRSSRATWRTSSAASPSGRRGRAARHAVERRRVRLRGGGPQARLHGRVRPRRGRDRLGATSAACSATRTSSRSTWAARRRRSG